MSKQIESRAEFQELAEERLNEAKLLLDAERWSGAYYLAGYAVELALKACIIKRLMETDAFPEREFSKNCDTHVIKNLVRLARLNDLRETSTDVNLDLRANWQTANGWSEEKRYHRIEKVVAETLYAAITDPLHGVSEWIKMHW